MAKLCLTTGLHTGEKLLLSKQFLPLRILKSVVKLCLSRTHQPVANLYPQLSHRLMIHCHSKTVCFASGSCSCCKTVKPSVWSQAYKPAKLQKFACCKVGPSTVAKAHEYDVGKHLLPHAHKQVEEVNFGTDFWSCIEFSESSNFEKGWWAPSQHEITTNSSTCGKIVRTTSPWVPDSAIGWNIYSGWHHPN